MSYKYLLVSLLFIIGCGGDQYQKETHVTKEEIKKEVLILYDTAGSFGDTGKTNAMFLENLLGHFDINIVSKPAIEYTENEMNNKIAVFYIGTTYDVLSYYSKNSTEKLAYKEFYKDIATKNKTIVWLNYNLPLLEQFWIDNNINNSTFAQKFGIRSDSISQLNYNRVSYKNTELFKGVIPFAMPGFNLSLCENEGNNSYACSLELNLIKIVDSQKSEVFATTYSTIAGTNTPVSPYITRGGKFWFVGDIPFSYVSEEDRYLAFSDLLHDMLNIPHQESHKAIMRLEDVSSKTRLSNLNTIAKYMKYKNIPFSVATIPQYEDPLGIDNDGIPVTELLSESIIGTRLKELYDEGAIHIIQHGTTHQFHSSLDENISEIKNPYNGLSGDDFEFMRVIENADLSYSYLYPTENDSATWATDRIIQGKNILTQLDIQAFAWEAPHYMAGPNHYRAIAKIYPIQYARLLYFPKEGNSDINLKYKFVGQFFPFIIKKDIYGYTIIPENIHNIKNAPNEGYRKLLAKDVIHFSKKLKVVRDGVASFYYHPFLGDSYLKKIIEGIEAEGYEFVSAPSLVEKL